MVKHSLILLALTWLGLASASDGLVTLYRNSKVTVVSGPGGLMTGRQHLSVIFEPEAFVNFEDLDLDLSVERAKEAKQVKLEPTPSPLVYTGDVDLEHAGSWQATLKIQDALHNETIRFSIRLLNPSQIAALIASLSMVILASVGLAVFNPKRAGVRKQQAVG